MMALLTLFLLIALAVPYSFMTNHQASASRRLIHRRDARNGARTAIALAQAELERHHRLNQFHAWAGERSGDARREAWDPSIDHRVDGLEEMSVNVATTLREGFDGEGYEARDPQGSVWSARIEDEQGKININTAPPSLLANIFGSAIVESTEKVDDGFDISVEEGAENFPRADGRGERGYFVIGSTLISYSQREGNTFHSCRFVVEIIDAFNNSALGRTRDKPTGVFNFNTNIENNPEDLRGVRRGHLMMPVVAYTAAYWRLLGASEDQLKDYANVDELREISELMMIEEAKNLAQSPEAFSPAQWARARRHLTVHSRGPLNNGFGLLHRGTRISEANPDWPTDLQFAFSDRYRPLVETWMSPNDPRRRDQGFRAGTTIRARYLVNRGDAFEMGDDRFGLVISGGTRNLVAAPHPLMETDFEGAEFPWVLLETREITPINVNTASHEVIVANLKGMRAGSNFISAAEARTIADAILFLRYRDVALPDKRFKKLDELIESVRARSPRLRAGLLRGDADFVRLLRAITIGEIGSEGINDDVPNLVAAFLRMPYRRLSLSNAPFIYHSYGSYSIKGVAREHNPAGMEVAHSTLEEIVEIGSARNRPSTNFRDMDRALRWEWRDQNYLLSMQDHGLGHILRTVNAGTFSGTGGGTRTLGAVDVPLMLASEITPARPKAIFDSRSSGRREWRLEGRASEQSRLGMKFLVDADYSVALSGRGHFDAIGDGEFATQVGDLGAGQLAFWYQIPEDFSQSDELVIFDAGLEEHVNRLALIWGATGFENKLTLMMADRTLQEGLSTVSMEFDEERWRAGLWVFIRCSWDNMRLGGLSLLVDHMARGGTREVTSGQDDQHLNSSVTGASGSQVRELAVAITDQSTSLTLAGGSAGDSLPSIGVVRIGDEVIEYQGVVGTTLNNLVRGARGSGNARSHPFGAKVSVFGYAATLGSTNDAPYLYRGGASLSSESRGNGRFRYVSSLGDQDDNYLNPTRLSPTAVLHTKSLSEINLTAISPSFSGTIPNLAIVYIRGPSWRRYSTHPVLAQEIPDFALPTDPDSPVRVLITPQQPPVVDFRNGDVAEQFLLVSGSGGTSFRVVAHLERQANGELTPVADESAEVGRYFLGGVATTTDADTSIQAGDWAQAGSVVIVTSLHAGGTNLDYFDPAATTAPAVANNRFARVQVATSETDIGGQPFFPWIRYNDLFTWEHSTLFAFTQDGNLRSQANDLAAALQTVSSTPGTPMGFREWDDPNGQPRTLPAGRNVNPVFVMFGACGLGDEVTLMYEARPSNERYLNVNLHKTVVRLARRDGNNTALWTDGGDMTANVRLTESYYARVDQIGNRLGPILRAMRCVAVKFPEPGLPTGMPTTLRFGGTNYGGAVEQSGRGKVDELRAYDRRRSRIRLVVDLNAAALEARIDSYPRSGTSGVIQIGNEFILYRGIRRTTPNGASDYTLLDLERGIFQTTPSDHPRRSIVLDRPAANFTTLETELTQNSTQFTLTNPGRFFPDAGILKIGDEYLAYSRIERIRRRSRLSGLIVHDLVRGLLGSEVAQHSVGTIVVTQDHLRTFIPTGNISPEEGVIRFEGGDDPFPFGFVRAEAGEGADLSDMEIIGYNRLSRDRLHSGDFRPMGTGLFRGAYGTIPQNWIGLDSVMVEMPVRYPDFMSREMRAADATVFAGTEVAHFEGREAFSNVELGLLRWMMDAGGKPFPETDDAAPYGAKLVFRVDSNVDWSKKPIVLEGADKPSRVRRQARLSQRALRREGVTDPSKELYAIEWSWDNSRHADTQGAEAKEIFVDLGDVIPEGVNAFEWRVYFYYKDQAFERGEYKESQRFRGLSVEMDAKTRVLSREERR